MVAYSLIGAAVEDWKNLHCSMLRHYYTDRLLVVASDVCKIVVDEVAGARDRLGCCSSRVGGFGGRFPPRKPRQKGSSSAGKASRTGSCGEANS